MAYLSISDNIFLEKEVAIEKFSYTNQFLAFFKRRTLVAVCSSFAYSFFLL
jgi:hypothetical protein